MIIFLDFLNYEKKSYSFFSDFFKNFGYKTNFVNEFILI